MPLAQVDSHDRTVRLPEFGEAGDRSDTPRPPSLVLGLGPYRDPELIGAGGMGVVYRATAPDGRRVAVKVIPAGATVRDLAGRLEREWQTLATLDHPNVARVFDSGTTPDGRPYFAMDYIPGVPLCQYADGNRLTVAERLHLFLGVAAAVSHLHRRAIIHRDLKPGNILVTDIDGAPVPKLIDFGLAKVLGAAAAATTAGGYVGTPNYMAPEQAGGTGGPVDTRADVYALGVILFELLTGGLPLASPEGRATSVLELLIRLQVADAPPPSSRLAGESVVPLAALRRTDPAGLRAAVAGDLDRVVLKALARDREGRYGTVEALADDVRRYLANEPVSVAAPGRASQFSRFVRRNKAVVAGLVIGFVGLVAVVAGTTYGLVRARAAEHLATERLDEVERTRARLEVSLGETAAAQGETEATLKRTELARRIAEERLNALKVEAAGIGDPQEMLRVDRLAPVPPVNAALKALAAAVEHPDLHPQLRVGIRQHTANMLVKLGDAAAAADLLAAAYAERRKAHRDDDPKVIELAMGLANAHGMAGRADLGVPLLERHLKPLDPAGPPVSIPHLHRHIDLALGYERRKEFDKAATEYRAVLACGVPVYGEKHPLLASAAIALAVRVVDRDPDEAARLMDGIASVVGNRQLSLHSNPRDAEWAVGWVYRRANRPAKALPFYQRATERWLAENPHCPRGAVVRSELAGLLSAAGEADEAARHAVAAYLTLERVAETHRADLTLAKGRVVTAYLDANQFAAAARWANRPLPVVREKAPPPRLADPVPAP